MSQCAFVVRSFVMDMYVKKGAINDGFNCNAMEGLRRKVHHWTRERGVGKGAYNSKTHIHYIKLTTYSDHFRVAPCIVLMRFIRYIAFILK